MSHYNDFKTIFKDEDALIKSLCRCKTVSGKQIQRAWIQTHAQATALQGYDRGAAKTAHIIIPKHYLVGIGDHQYDTWNDMGFLKEKDGSYQALISDKYDGKWLGTLTTYYNIECARNAYTAKGMKCEEVLDDKGRIQLIAEFNVAPTSNNYIKQGGYYHG